MKDISYQLINPNLLFSSNYVHMPFIKNTFPIFYKIFLPTNILYTKIALFFYIKQKSSMGELFLYIKERKKDIFWEHQE